MGNRSQQQLYNVLSTFWFSICYLSVEEKRSVVCVGFHPGYYRKYEAHTVIFTDYDSQACSNNSTPVPVSMRSMLFILRLRVLRLLVPWKSLALR